MVGDTDVAATMSRARALFVRMQVSQVLLARRRTSKFPSTSPELRKLWLSCGVCSLKGAVRSANTVPVECLMTCDSTDSGIVLV